MLPSVITLPTPSNATAGVIFAPQPVIRIEDQFGNLRSSDNSAAVTASRSAGAGVLQGATNQTVTHKAAIHKQVLRIARGAPVAWRGNETADARNRTEAVSRFRDPG